MSVILEFSIGADRFNLGRALDTTPPVQLELERIVPTGNELVPFIWAEGSESALDGFEQSVHTSDWEVELTALDRLADARLYEIAWNPRTESLIDALHTAGGTIFEARSIDGTWHFTVRFPDHASVTTLHESLTELQIDIRIDNITSVTESDRGGYAGGLTPEQRESLLAAVDAGYFHVPRQSDLEEIAAALGISPQAASERIRRGTDTILRKVLFGD